MQEIIAKTESFVKFHMGKDSTGHDWYHVDRVRKNAAYIAMQEQVGDSFIIEMAALLHDIADEKLVGKVEEKEGALQAFLKSLPLPDSKKEAILQVISGVSYQGGHNSTILLEETKVVQDADRLDAIGAIGIARAFAFGGKKGQSIFDPQIPHRTQMTKEEYRNGESTSVNHFYEKLLKLKDGLHTATAKRLAEKRHTFMETFLQEFYHDWNGEHDHS